MMRAGFDLLDLYVRALLRRHQPVAVGPHAAPSYARRDSRRS
jgi:hypothetical protein